MAIPLRSIVQRAGPILMLCSLIGFPLYVHAAPVFINEIHYDNAGTDAGEAIEIAGPAGTDLTGWSIVLYNGNGGAVYNTMALSGIIPNQMAGFGTAVFNYPTNGIQNGSPDGIALVNNTSTVQQFLSYEGSFTAVGGPANGLLSTDIGVSEGSATAVGDSLQLQGSGTDSNHFVWASAMPNTFGNLNTGQSFSGPGLILTGIVDGPITGGLPKAIEMVAIADIADLSVYGVGSANNGGGSDGQEFTFPAVSISAGTFVYLATESTEFQNFFGFPPDYTGAAASINGDDAIELFWNGMVIDVFGEINVDGTGQPWEYTDGWAYRVDGTGPDGDTFVLANWYFSGPNALDGETSNTTAGTPFPLGTFTARSNLPPSLFSASLLPVSASLAAASCTE